MTQRHMQDLVRDQDPVTLPPEATVQEACTRMRERRVGAVLVTEEDAGLVGIFTGRDAVCRVLAEGRTPSDTALGDVMTAAPHTADSGHTAIEVLRLMQDCGCRHMPITEGGRLVGIVSRGDFRGLEQARLDDETGLWERI